MTKIINLDFQKQANINKDGSVTLFDRTGGSPEWESVNLTSGQFERVASEIGYKKCDS